MRNFLFYKARSNLGLINKPFGGDSRFFDQVFFAPDYILTSEFLGKIAGEKVLRFDFTYSQNLNKSRYFETIAVEAIRFRDLIISTTDKDDFRIVVGGDHSVSLGSVAASLLDYGSGNVGFIQIDSHLDLHLTKTSPSGNFHGMWLRALTSQFDHPSINLVSRTKLNPKNMLFIGNIVAEAEEINFARRSGMRIVGINEMKTNLPSIVNAVERMVKNLDHIHLSFDVDGIDDTLSPGTGIPAKNGLLSEHYIPIVEACKKARSISLDVVEVNHKKDIASKSRRIAQDVILRILGSI